MPFPLSIAFECTQSYMDHPHCQCNIAKASRNFFAMIYKGSYDFKFGFKQVHIIHIDAICFPL